MSLEELYDILLSDNPSSILRDREEELFCLIPGLKACKGFNQNNEWHIYDVYEHILHVVENVSPNLILRLAALFHDIGKPLSYTEDKKGVGHFYGHWETSQRLFHDFATRHSIPEDVRSRVSHLIYYHDINLSKLDSRGLSEIVSLFGEEGILQLFELKRADLLAQNAKYNYLLGEYDIQKKKLLRFSERNPD